MKDPIIINTDKEIVSEKVLKQLILKDLDTFLVNLEMDTLLLRVNISLWLIIDLIILIFLLFNYKFNCFVVIELKVTEIKKEHISQIQVYMNYSNKNLKTIYQDNTIGIIIAKKKQVCY